MSSPLKIANPHTIAKLLPNYRGSPLPHHIPIPHYAALKEANGECLQRTFLYKDFKEAFVHLVEISKLCASLNYFP